MYMTVKEIARDVVEHAADDCSIEQLIHDLRLQHHLDLADQESKAGKSLTTDQMKERFHSWADQNIKSTT